MNGLPAGDLEGRRGTRRKDSPLKGRGPPSTERREFYTN